MQTAVKTLEGLEREMTVTLSAEEVKEAYTEKLKEVAKTVKVDGFRKGKIPIDVIEKKLGSNIRQEVASDLIQKSFPKAIDENKIKIAGAPRVKPGELIKDQPLEYTVNFEIFPEFTLKDLEGQSLETIKSEVADADVNKMLETIQKQFADWTEIDQKAANGHRVVIDFDGFLNNEPFEGGKSAQYPLELGSKSMIPGFEDGLIGVVSGEEKDLNIMFPADYPNEKLAGKETVFKIKVHKVEEAKLPNLDDTLAEKMGIKGGITELQNDVRKQMELELRRIIESRNKATILDKLIELNPITLPGGLVETEIKHLQEMTLQQMAAQQGKKELPKIDLPRDPFVSQAERRVKLGLLLAEVIKNFSIVINHDKVHEKIKEMASSYQQPDQVEKWYHNNREMLSEIEAVVLEEEAIARLLGNANVSEKLLSYQDAIKPPQESK